MRWMEQCSYIAASRVGRSGHLLTGSMDSLAFAQPTRVADIMYITAQVRSIVSVCGTAVSVCAQVASAFAACGALCRSHLRPPSLWGIAIRD